MTGKKYTLKEIGQTIPTGGKIVALLEHKGFVMIATEHHLFRGNFDQDGFRQCLFYEMEEKDSD